MNREKLMDKVIHQADQRGHSNHGWLKSYHSFSFANYVNPNKTHFGALRVLNDDTIERGDPNSVKGIVHKKCNTMLGLHNDSIEELQLSIDYLKKWEVKKMERIHAQENIKK